MNILELLLANSDLKKTKPEKILEAVFTAQILPGVIIAKKDEKIEKQIDISRAYARELIKDLSNG